jgi:transposase
MGDKGKVPKNRVRELEREKERLQEENQRLRQEIERLQEQVQDLEKQLRASHRQAAPFSNGKRVALPKRAGRKAGQGPFHRRTAPPEELVTKNVSAPAPEACPHCGGALMFEREEIATITDIPQQPRPVVTRYRVAVCHCSRCGKTVRGAAPGLAADQFGATAHRVGPGVKAAAHSLHYATGVPVRKVPQILKEHLGVSITQGALTQDALRRGQAAVGQIYQQLRQEVRQAAVINTDDTGWRVAGSTAHLMVFVTAASTVYQIRSQHRNEEVRELIPADYAGVMGTDRGKSYDAEEFNAVQQQKCWGHLKRNIDEVLDRKQGGACTFGLVLKDLLDQGLELHHKRSALSSADYQLQVQELDDGLSYHLRDRRLTDTDNQRLLDGIGRHQDRGNLLRFLQVDGVEPTNNRAERALRPAVIARKVSQCSKNTAGAETFTAFLTVLQTALQQGVHSTVEYLRNLFSP